MSLGTMQVEEVQGVAWSRVTESLVGPAETFPWILF